VSPIMPPADFDPLVGTFTVAHRRLRQRLVGSDDWDHFNGTSTSHVILGGFGLVEDNVINLPGDSYRAIGLRSFDPTTGRWAGARPGAPPRRGRRAPAPGAGAPCSPGRWPARR
jgi:hypothetical protein